MNQKEGVYTVVTSFLAKYKVKFSNEEALELTSEQRKEVIGILAVAFHADKIEMTGKAR